MIHKTFFDIPIVNYSFGLIVIREKGISLRILIVKKPDAKTLGITSYCKNGHHVLLFDFDGNSLEEVFFQMKTIQKYYNLPDIYLFENDTERSFHAICLAKMPLFKAIEIISQTTADKAFKKAPLRYPLRRWVLRVEKKGKRKKPKFLLKLKGNNNKYKQSNPHRLFLQMNYGIKISKKGFDNEKELDLFEYYTANRTE